MSELKKLTLHEHHLSQGAKFTPFAGWNMPVSYGSSLSEHLLVRNSVGLFDVSHMGEIEVAGAEAEDFLNFALTNDLKKCGIGQAQYSILCNEDGGTLDDLIVYRREQNKFLLCVNASNTSEDFKVLSNRASGFDCELKNLSSFWGQLALQGPQAEATLSKTINENLSQLSKMHFIEGSWMGFHSIIARTGYTGEDGFEIYCPVNEVSNWANALARLSVQWVGLAARDSLRLEAGFPLYGHELCPDISPVQAGLSWAIGWHKLRFCGRSALLNEKENQPINRIFYYLANDRRIPREGCQILGPDDEVVGKILSGGFSPLHQKPMGTGLIQNKGIQSSDDQGWHALLRNTKIPLVLGKPPLKRPVA